MQKTNIASGNLKDKYFTGGREGGGREGGVGMTFCVTQTKI